MFWDTAAIEENSLQKLLKSAESTENLNLDDVLLDPFVLQELRNGNRTLITFLTEKANLIKILSCAVQPSPSPDDALAVQYKKSHTCSEILTVRNNDELVNALVKCDDAIDLLLKSLDDVEHMNHLVASFFMKIIMHLLQRHFAVTMNMFESSEFVAKCIGCLRLGAFAELLQNIVKIPSFTDEINQLKEHLLKINLASKLVGLFDSSQSPVVHENSADVYIDIVRNLRDVLYSYEVKEDELHDSFFTKEIADDLVERMLHGDTSPSCVSVLLNCSEVLGTLIETNTIMFCPSHLIESEKLGESWTGGTPGEPQMDPGHEIWHPDQNRVVETAVAARTAEIVALIVADLEKDQPSDAWLYLLRLLVILCDTNHLPTHEALLAGMRAADFHKLFDLVHAHPLCSIFHRLLHKVVTYILYSNVKEGVSPLIAYFFEEFSLLKLLSSGLRPYCALRKLSLISIRSFHTYLALGLEQARQHSPNKIHLDGLLKENADWSVVSQLLSAYLEWNQTDNESGQPSARSSNGSILGDPTLDFFEEDRIKAEQLNEYDSMRTSKMLPETFDEDISLPPSMSDRFNIRSQWLSSEVDVDTSGCEGVEKEMQNMCFARCSGSDDWPLFPLEESNAGASKGVGSKAVFTSPKLPPGSDSDDSFKVDWDSPKSTENTSPSKTNNELDVSDDWPSTPGPVPNGVTSLNDSTASAGSTSSGKDDFWADFNEIRDPTKHTAEEDGWPAAGNTSSLNESDDWPGSSSSDGKPDASPTPIDPVMIGFATGLLNTGANSPLKAGNESEC